MARGKLKVGQIVTILFGKTKKSSNFGNLLKVELAKREAIFR
jgi:hypothetical protein